MKSKLHVVEVVEAEHEASLALPEHVQLSLAGIAGQAKEGLLALAVHTFGVATAPSRYSAALPRAG